MDRKNTTTVAPNGVVSWRIYLCGLYFATNIVDPFSVVVFFQNTVVKRIFDHCAMTNLFKGSHRPFDAGSSKSGDGDHGLSIQITLLDKFSNKGGQVLMPYGITQQNHIICCQIWDFRDKGGSNMILSPGQ